MSASRSSSASETPLDLLDASAVEPIAELRRRALGVADAPSAAELAVRLFAPDQSTVVRGDPAVGVVVAVPAAPPPGDAAAEGGFVRLLVVDPDHRRVGHGRALLRAAERDLVAGRDAPVTITVGADPPYYLFPGVETTRLAMLCLLERRRYVRHEATFNMSVDLTALAEDPGGWTLAGPEDATDIDAFTAAHWQNWAPEVRRALAKESLTIGRDASGIVGFCAWNVNRSGMVGPVAVRPDLIGKGVGEPLLLGALHTLRASGAARAEVSWVGPIVPYARVGGTVGRVFFVYKKVVKP